MLRISERWLDEQLALLGVLPENAPNSDDVLDLLAVTRLVADRVSAEPRLRDPSRFRPRRLQLFLDEVDRDFLPQLLAETRRRTAVDPVFAARLKEARAAIASMAKRFSALHKDIVGEIPDELANDPKLPKMLQAAVAPLLVVAGIFLFYLFWYTRKVPVSDDDEDGDDGNGDDGNE